MTQTSFAARGKRIPIEELAPGDEIRLSVKDVTVQEIREDDDVFVIRSRGGLSFRIPKGSKIRRQHS